MSYTLVFHIFILSIIQTASSSQRELPLSQDLCVSQDFPNQHAQQYPTLVSGNLNGTILIVPIPLDTARQIIPKEYGIIENAYRTLLPSFPDGMYPMMAQIVHDHDLQLPAYNASLPDFSRASLEFPFLDIFGGGRTPFRWAATFMITAENEMAIEGAESYGAEVYPSAFDPPCDAYGTLPSGSTTYARSWSNSNEAQGGIRFMTIEAVPSPGNVPYPMDFIANVTNQPVFANTRVCDYYTRLFNTTLSSSAEPVVGSVSANLEPFNKPRTWSGVYGWRLATPFLEPPVLTECKQTP
ncbi:uncharacterized protein F4812DRAFT_304318 [Daldinia caldariorum]|uniref:uncharacterized protein n=1 Tax=Daldinia caldariorum TaxID=326644 RepID=UPI0020073FB7|nr:uncharacterized protein F4812DRAFT_304318 [Daldinia caldariorum]KAI1469821.1 hypothetical protein F4812DRAFT_304318 [Daldinia caldariorum]